MPHPTRSRMSAFHVFAAQWTDPDWLSQFLHDDEREFVASAVRGYQRRLRKADATAVMRLEGIVMLYVLARRAGLSALSAGVDEMRGVDGDDGPKSSDGDDVGKAQERLRKALKEFEDTLGVAVDGGASGLADMLRPLLKTTEGVVEEAAASGNGQSADFHEA